MHRLEDDAKIQRINALFKMDITSKCRKREYVELRQATVAALREDYGWVWKRIGAAIGWRDHSTCIHAYNEHRARVEMSHLRMYDEYFDKFSKIKHVLTEDVTEVYDPYKLRGAVFMW